MPTREQEILRFVSDEVWAAVDRVVELRKRLDDTLSDLVAQAQAHVAWEAVTKKELVKLATKSIASELEVAMVELKLTAITSGTEIAKAAAKKAIGEELDRSTDQLKNATHELKVTATKFRKDLVLLPFACLVAGVIGAALVRFFP